MIKFDWENGFMPHNALKKYVVRHVLCLPPQLTVVARGRFVLVCDVDWLCGETMGR